MKENMLSLFDFDVFRLTAVVPFIIKGGKIRSYTLMLQTSLPFLVDKTICF